MTADDPAARSTPEDAVDAIDEKARADEAGDADPAGEPAADEDTGDEPAFAIDLDPEDQGTADAAAANPD